MKIIKDSLLALGFCTGLATTVFGQVLSEEFAPGDRGVFAYWNFNTFDKATDTLLLSDFTWQVSEVGDANLSLNGWGGGVDDFNGSLSNAQFGDSAGASLSLTGGTDLAGNGTYIELSFSMANLAGLEIDYWSRRSGTGFTNNQWSYSSDGIDFTDFGSVVNPSSATAGAIVSLTTSALDEVSTAYLRYTLDDATGASGNNRIDNLTLSATIIPEPSTYSLLFGAGILALAGVRRRFARCSRVNDLGQHSSGAV